MYAFYIVIRAVENSDSFPRSERLSSEDYYLIFAVHVIVTYNQFQSD